MKRSNPRQHAIALLLCSIISVVAALGTRAFLPPATAPITQVGIILVSALVLIAYLARQERDNDEEGEGR